MATLFKAIFAGIKAFFRLIALFFKVIYRILKALRIRLLVLYLLVCLIVQLSCHAFDGQNAVYFWIGAAACLFVTVVSWGFRLRELIRRRNAQAGRELAYTEDGEPSPQQPVQQPQPAQPPVQSPPQPVQPPPAPVYPRWYDAAGMEGYLFAEYADRYELYRRTERGIELVRVDKK